MYKKYHCNFLLKSKPKVLSLPGWGNPIQSCRDSFHSQGCDQSLEGEGSPATPVPLLTRSPFRSKACLALCLGRGVGGRLGRSLPLTISLRAPFPHWSDYVSRGRCQIPATLFLISGNLFFSGRTLTASPCFSGTLCHFLKLCPAWQAQDLGKQNPRRFRLVAFHSGTFLSPASVGKGDNLGEK